jgi:beta-glucanase (GH16 family)
VFLRRNIFIGVLSVGFWVPLFAQNKPLPADTARQRSKKPEPKPKKEEWKLEWNDGMERFDASLWSARDFDKGTGSTGYSPLHVFSDNGHMVLMLDTVSYNDKPFTGAEVVGLKEIGYGKVEVRMRIPKGRGVACALIATSVAGADLKPHDEISVEFRGSETRSVYFNYFKRKARADNGNSYFLPFDAAEEYHTYTIEWTKKYIKWFIDGKLYYQTYERIPGSLLRITFSVWSNMNQDHEVDPHALPALFLIDNVKYFIRNHK